LPLLTPSVEPRVRACILAKCEELKCVPLKLGGIEDHLHLLVRMKVSRKHAAIALIAFARVCGYI
jgi:hypothetical protein